LMSCFRSHVDYGMNNPMKWKFSGNIQDFPTELYNLSFLVCVTLTMPSIIGGIIIDAFSEVRSQAAAIEEDTKTMCFICNIERDAFDQSGLDFEKHIRSEHNMWSYIWYVIHLSSRKRVDFTGQEQNVWDLLTQGKISFMPLKKARIIQGKNQKEKRNIQSLYTKVDALESMLTKLARTSETLAQKLDSDQLRIDRSFGELRSKLATDTLRTEKALTEVKASENDNIQQVMKELQSQRENMCIILNLMQQMSLTSTSATTTTQVNCI